MPATCGALLSPAGVVLDRLADRLWRQDGRSRRFHRKPTGSAALWSLGRHAAFSGWTPSSPLNTAPHPTATARRCQRAGNPRDACRCCRCSRPLPAPAGRRTPPRLPARFQRAGGVALPPLHNQSVGAPIPAEGVNLLSAPPAAYRPSGLGAACWAAAGRLAPRPAAWPPFLASDVAPLVRAASTATGAVSSLAGQLAVDRVSEYVKR